MFMCFDATSYGEIKIVIIMSLTIDYNIIYWAPWLSQPSTHLIMSLLRCYSPVTMLLYWRVKTILFCMFVAWC